MLAQHRLIWAAATCLAAILTFSYTWEVDSPVVDQLPAPINLEAVRANLGYPEAAYNAGIQGDVVLDIKVNSRGEYLSHTIVESFHPLLRIPTEYVAPLLKFKPAMYNGKSVPGQVQVVFPFVIPD
ncbi:MAG: energy transducer TonB [Bacteroidota bacterium]